MPSLLPFPQRPEMDGSGLLLVEKGQGVTSFQVVAHLRRLLSVHKIGHGGTLDPLATGLLPILVGEGTKLTQFLTEQDKEYEVTLLLGVKTDTLDVTGRVLEEQPVPDLTEDAIQGFLKCCLGEITQVPPMFSALHHQGRRLHELAREGVTVERQPRTVCIHAIELLELALPRLSLRVACGKGTYIRSLCSDLGEAMGCGATVERLVRTRVGRFTLAEAVPWRELVLLGDPGSLWDRLLPPEVALAHLPAVVLPEDAVVPFCHGQAVPSEGVNSDQLYRVMGHGIFLGVGVGTVQSTLRPIRLFHASTEKSRRHPAERA